MSTRLLFALLLIATAVAAALYPPQAAVWFARASPVVEISGWEQSEALRRDFWAHGSDSYLLELSAREIDAAVSLEGRGSLSSTALTESDAASVVSEGSGDNAQRFVLLLTGPRHEGSAVLSLTSQSAQSLAIDSLILRKVSKTYFIARRLALALATLGLLSLLWRERHTTACAGGLIFLGTFVVYGSMSLPGLDNRTDNELYVPSALSLLIQGDLELSEYAATHLVTTKPYRIHRDNGDVTNRYPFGTSVIAAPLIGLAHYLAGSEPDATWRRLKAASFVAALLGAASAATLFAILIQLALAKRTAVLLSLLFAFATPQWPTHGGGLWSSNLSVLLLLLAVVCLARDNGRGAWLSAVPLAFAIATRPTAILFFPVVALYLLKRDRRQLAVWTSLATVGFAGFLFASQLIYGNPIPPYYDSHAGMLSSQQVLTAFAGLLVSPNRGLFIFCPVAVLSMLGAIATIRREPSPATDLFRLFGIYCLGYVIFVATFDVWWGGGSYGPRLLAELFPFLVLLLVPWLERVRQSAARARALAWATLALFVAFGLFVSVRGVTDPATRAWNRWPQRVTLHQERLWDWNDMQIFRTTTQGPTR